MNSSRDGNDKRRAAEAWPRWKKALYLALPFLITLVLLEGLFRLFGYAPFRPPSQSPARYFLVSDDHLGFRNQALGVYRYTLIEEAPLVTTDSLGYRTSHTAAAAEAPLIVFVGDSAVFCAEVDDDQTVASEVAKSLLPYRHVRVLNAGVRGYNTLQTQRMLAETLARYANVAAVVYLYSSNDYVETLNPIVHLPLQAPTMRYDSLVGRWQEKEIEVPSAPVGKPFTPTEERLAWKVTQALRRHSALFNQVGIRLRALVGTPDLLRQKTLLPNGSLGPIDTNMPAWKAQRQWARANGADEALAVLLRRMQRLCQDAGTVFLTTAFTRGSEDPAYDEFARIAERAGVRFVDIKPSFTAAPTTYAALRQDGIYDPHYGTVGTQMFARALLPTLRSVLSELSE